jgi:serine/threonine protein kinase
VGRFVWEDGGVPAARLLEDEEKTLADMTAEIPDRLGDEYRDLVRRMLARHPDRRPSAAAVVATPFLRRAALGEEAYATHRLHQRRRRPRPTPSDRSARGASGLVERRSAIAAGRDHHTSDTD